MLPTSVLMTAYAVEVMAETPGTNFGIYQTLLPNVLLREDRIQGLMKNSHPNLNTNTQNNLTFCQREVTLASPAKKV